MKVVSRRWVGVNFWGDNKAGTRCWDISKSPLSPPNLSYPSLEPGRVIQIATPRRLAHFVGANYRLAQPAVHIISILTRIDELYTIKLKPNQNTRLDIYTCTLTSRNRAHRFVHTNLSNFQSICELTLWVERGECGLHESKSFSIFFNLLWTVDWRACPMYLCNYS